MMTMARSVQRVPLANMWKAQGFECIDPNAKKHEKGKVRIQRVWIYEDDYKAFGITDDCKKCLHNQRWGYNASKMIHS